MEHTVQQIVADIMGVPVASIHNDSSPDTIASWDSLKHMNLMLALEQNFAVTFSEEQIAEMMNIELIILTIKDLL